MEHLKEMTERLKATSLAIASYIDGGLYLNEFDDQSEDYTLDVLFPRVLEMTIEELKELGIRLQYDRDEILENPRMTQAVVALREVFDKDYLCSLIRQSKKLKLMLTGIIDSTDIEAHTRGAKIVDLLKNVGTADRYKLEEIDALEENFITNREFQAHISACIERCTPRSTASNDDVIAYRQVGQAVSVIYQGWKAIWEVVEKSGLLPLPTESCINYFNEFASQWYQVEKAQTYNWMLAVTEQELAEHPVYRKALYARHEEWQQANPYLRNFRETPSIEYAAVTGIALTLQYLGQSWDPMKSVKNLLAPNGIHLTSPSDALEYVFAGYRGKDNEETSAAHAWWGRYSQLLLQVLADRTRNAS